MYKESLFSKFDNALIWNGILFFIGRISRALLTIFVFYRLSSTYFSVWANVFSIVYLASLIADMGLRKSIPRFSPEFSKDRAYYKTLLTFLFISYCCVLFVLLVIFIKAIPFLSRSLNVNDFMHFFYLGSLVFFLASIVSFLRLIYYAHFWNKHFNVIESATMTISTLAVILVAALQGLSQEHILSSLFYGEIAHLMIVSVISGVKLITLWDNIPDSHLTLHNRKKVVGEFITHSGVMWASNSIQSISERNVLIPFLSIAFGHTASTTFKIANDIALLFQRCVLKIIGTNDTVFLSYIESSRVENIKDNQALFFHAFSRLMEKIILMFLVLITLLVISSIFAQYQGISYNITILFFILTLWYLLSLLFLPFERTIEVKRHYIVLFFSFTPHIIVGLLMLCIASSTHMKSIFSVPIFIIFVGIMRLISLSIKVYYASKYYRLPFP